ncbi:molybdopterin-dependent oxidoreductase [Chloroflexus sp.]|uniref:molybdopterin-dependent oxidoreductase n=1 Tax=Chloroflexus sp. TaxID=1904827 RepID=UPI002629FEF9|nr:molybdopterin-dependent oxidoreductase [uncultured Chloroflexus sp.]
MSTSTINKPFPAPPSIKDTGLLRHTDGQLKFDPSLSILDEAVTALDHMFARNQQPVPDLHPTNWELSIDGLVRHPLTIDYHDLYRQPLSSMFAALIGSRHDRDSHAAIANAEWIGAPVALFLSAAGVKPQASFAACWSYGPQPIARYLPIAKLWQDGMLAYAVNGQPLPAIHGGPVRLVVPGWAGTYWVKWIKRITLLSADSAPPEAHLSGELEIDCQLFNLAEVAHLHNRSQPLRGVAWSAARGVAQVSLSLDEGSWEEAILDCDLGPRAWRRFVYHGPPLGNHHLLAVRVTDYHGQSVIRQWQLNIN